MRLDTSQLSFNSNEYIILSRVINNTSCCDLSNEKLLREVIVKIELGRINIQEGVTVEVLLNSGTTGLVMSSKFAKKQEFKLKKIERLIYMRNMNKTFNKERPIEHIIKINIYYQGYKERTEIDIIGGQK